MKPIEVTTQEQFDLEVSKGNEVIVRAGIFEAMGNSIVHAYDNSTVYTFDNSTVNARDNSTVNAYDDSIVYARDKSRVVAYDNGVTIIDKRHNTVKPSEVCKKAGLKNLNEFAEMTGESVQSLNNWYKNNPRRFHLLLNGVLFERAVNSINANNPVR